MLDNNRLKLRAIEPEDLDILYKWENDASLWALGSTMSPISRFTLKNYIEESHLNIFEAKQLRLIITLKHSQEPVGAVDLYDVDVFHQRAAIGILIDNQFQGQGIGMEALQLLREYCFDFLHMHQLYAYIPSTNIPSIRLFSNSGFSQTGVLKDWLKQQDGYSDVIFTQCINQPL